MIRLGVVLGTVVWHLARIVLKCTPAVLGVLFSGALVALIFYVLNLRHVRKRTLEDARNAALGLQRALETVVAQQAEMQPDQASLDRLVAYEKALLAAAEALPAETWARLDGVKAQTASGLVGDIARIAADSLGRMGWEAPYLTQEMVQGSGHHAQAVTMSLTSYKRGIRYGELWDRLVRFIDAMK